MNYLLNNYRKFIFIGHCLGSCVISVSAREDDNEKHLLLVFLFLFIKIADI